MTGPSAWWTAMSHEEIYRAVQAGPGPAASQQATDLWRQAEELITAAEARLQAALADSHTGWAGEGGDAARGGLGSLKAWALDAANDVRITAAAVEEQSWNAGELRRRVEPPLAFDQVEARILAASDPTGVSAERLEAERRAQEDRREYAAQALREYVSQSSQNAQHLDYWTVPPAVAVDATPFAPGGGPGIGSAAAPPGASAGVGPGGEAGAAPAGSSAAGSSGAGSTGSGAPGPGTAGG